MSIKVMTWVWEHGPKDPTERLVLLAIADHADDKGHCFPSMIGIAEKSCVTERGARGIVRRLEQDGWVETKVGGGRGGKSQYRVLMVQNPEPHSRNDKPGMTNPEPHSRNMTTLNPERDCTKPGTSVPPNRQGTISNQQQTRETAADTGFQDPTDREKLLAAMGVGPDGITGPDGRMIGRSACMVEVAKWCGAGLSLDQQCAVITEVCERERRKFPGWMPRGFGYFTQPMTDLAARKSRPLPSASAQHEQSSDRAKRKAFLRRVAGGTAA